MSDSLRLRVVLPAFLEAVPPRSSSAFDSWVSRVSRPRDLSPFVLAPTIDEDLKALIEAMDSAGLNDSQWFVCVPEGLSHHGMRAAGWVSGVVNRDRKELDLADPLIGEWEAGSSSLGARSEIREIGGKHRALILRHLQAAKNPSERSHAQLVERCAALMAIDDPQVLVRVELFVFDLKAFQDTVEVVVSILESVDVGFAA